MLRILSQASYAQRSSKFATFTYTLVTSTGYTFIRRQTSNNNLKPANLLKYTEYYVLEV